MVLFPTKFAVSSSRTYCRRTSRIRVGLLSVHAVRSRTQKPATTSCSIPRRGRGCFMALKPCRGCLTVFQDSACFVCVRNKSVAPLHAVAGQNSSANQSHGRSVDRQGPSNIQPSFGGSSWIKPVTELWMEPIQWLPLPGEQTGQSSNRHGFGESHPERTSIGQQRRSSILPERRIVQSTVWQTGTQTRIRTAGSCEHDAM